MRKEAEAVGAGKLVGAVANAVLILRNLANGDRPAGVASIARATGLNVSTTFNILRTLSNEGLVAFDAEAKTYRIGLAVLEFSAPLLGTNQADLIHPELERLSGEHNALIGLWKITPTERIVLVDRLVASNVVRVDARLGSRLPAYVGAVGRCVAATRDFSREELRQRFEALRWQAAPSFEAYEQDVAAARRDGYAFDFGQLFRGLDIVASVIPDHGGQARFGISGIAIAGQMSREELEAMATAIRDSAANISAHLYGRAAERVDAGARSAAARGERRSGRVEWVGENVG
jgi:DNA-binding IclR family transcriptional regulator